MTCLQSPTLSFVAKIGRYLSHMNIVANFIKLKEELSDTSCAELEPVPHDIICLIQSAGTMPSDL
jgi:hypothetical protein